MRTEKLGGKFCKRSNIDNDLIFIIDLCSKYAYVPKLFISRCET